MSVHSEKYYTVFQHDQDEAKTRMLTVETEKRVFRGCLAQWDFYDDVAVLNELPDSKYRQEIPGTFKDETFVQEIVPYTAIIEAKLEWEESSLVKKRPQEEAERLEDAYREYREARYERDLVRAIEPGKLLRDAGIDLGGMQIRPV